MVSSADEVIANKDVFPPFNPLICLGPNPDYDKSLVHSYGSPPFVTEGYITGDPGDGSTAEFCNAFACSTTGEISPSFPCEGVFCGVPLP